MSEMGVHTEHRRDIRRGALNILEDLQRRAEAAPNYRTEAELRAVLAHIDGKLQTAITLVEGSIREEFYDGSKTD